MDLIDFVFGDSHFKAVSNCIAFFALLIALYSLQVARRRDAVKLRISYSIERFGNVLFQIRNTGTVDAYIEDITVGKFFLRRFFDEKTLGPVLIDALKPKNAWEVTFRAEDLKLIAKPGWTTFRVHTKDGLVFRKNIPAAGRYAGAEPTRHVQRE